VVQWWAVYDPSGDISIGGLDTSNTVRVAFNSSPTQWILQDRHGTFEIDIDGTKVVSSTFAGNAGALRTLALIKMDLAPSTNTTTANNSAPAALGQLHPADTKASCPRGSLIQDCSQLFFGNCSKEKFNTCMDDAGSLAMAEADINACLADWSPGGASYLKALQDSKTELPCSYHPECFDQTITYQQSECLKNIGNWSEENPPSTWQNRLKAHGCRDCVDQWHMRPDTLLKCPQVQRTTYWFRPGPDDTCTPTLQSTVQ
jgi:hypothetical protein